MKHPNRKVEAIRKEYAWALISLKRNGVQSCFDNWLDDERIEYVAMTEDGLLTALANIRRGGKTIRVELSEL